MTDDCFTDMFSHADMGRAYLDASRTSKTIQEQAELTYRVFRTFALRAGQENGNCVCGEFKESDRNAKPIFDERDKDGNENSLD